MADASPQKPKHHVGHRIAFSVVAILLLFILVTLPFAVTSVFGDVVEQGNRTYSIGTREHSHEGIQTRVHIDLIALNEWEGSVSLRVTGYQSCGTKCPWGDRLIFVSVVGDEGEPDQLPPSETVTIPANVRDVTQAIKLPIVGDPIRYPFDRYHMALGIVVEHIAPDSTTRTMPPSEAEEYLSASVRARIPRVVMVRPEPMDGSLLQADGDIESYAYVGLLTFERPLYIKVLTVLLVLLVTAAAAYAVFLRPLDQLIINSGALVLGVWGIRSILLGSTVPGVTAVDLSLSVVILFLLVTITVRTLWLLEERSELHVIRRYRGTPTPVTEPAPQDSGRTPDVVPARSATTTDFSTNGGGVPSGPLVERT